MAKKEIIIKLTESDLHNIIRQCVNEANRYSNSSVSPMNFGGDVQGPTPRTFNRMSPADFENGKSAKAIQMQNYRKKRALWNGLAKNGKSLKNNRMLAGSELQKINQVLPTIKSLRPKCQYLPRPNYAFKRFDAGVLALQAIATQLENISNGTVQVNEGFFKNMFNKIGNKLGFNKSQQQQEPSINYNELTQVLKDVYPYIKYVYTNNPAQMRQCQINIQYLYKMINTQLNSVNVPQA